MARTPFPRLRLYARARALARKCAVTATWCAGTACWCSYGLLYTGLGLLYAGGALVVTSAFAAVCWLVSGE